MFVKRKIKYLFTSIVDWFYILTYLSVLPIKFVKRKIAAYRVKQLYRSTMRVALDRSRSDKDYQRITANTSLPPMPKRCYIDKIDPSTAVDGDPSVAADKEKS